MENVNGIAGSDNKLEMFIQRNRKRIFLCAGFVVVAIVGSAAGFAVMDTLRSRAFAGVEELDRRYEALRDTAAGEKNEEELALLADVKRFAEKNSGYASGRAWAIAGNIHDDRKEWAESTEAWSACAKAASKTYLAPAAWFQAAVAAEERGDTVEALRLYGECLSLSGIFPAAPRAQFSIARLQEAQNNKAAALEAYRALVSKWPQDIIWTNLAQSRIIVLEK